MFDTNGNSDSNLPRMVVSDLDGTLLGDPEATDRFIQWWRQLITPWHLVYASGRFFGSVVASIEESGLPAPDAIISDVGTDVRLYPSGTQMLDWTSRWWTTWQIEDVQAVLDSELKLEPQPSHCQSAYKRSYFVRDAQPDWLRKTQLRLRERRVAAELIYSSNRDLDVLPAGANKGTAVEFLAQKWRVPRTRVLVAGDSGNDLSMFTQGFRGIVVGNAQADLAGLFGANIYRSLHPFADGVIDGLDFWIHRRFASGG
jgi:sucrose-6F-phosphate phosphohydrolase